MKFKAIFEGAVAAFFAAIFSYFVFTSPATMAALAIRRRMPDAWFSSSIVLYATAVVFIASMAMAIMVFRIVYKQTRGESRKDVATRKKS
jgi:preprotein translocase subunit SecY